MINLLPPELKTGYVYARRNVALRKWVAAFLIALVGLGILATYGLFTIQQSTVNDNNQIAAAQNAFQKENSEATKKRVQDISNNFKLVVKVLSQEVLFSQLIKQIAATIPANANLTGLTINQVQGGIDISADAANYQAATQVQVNLADPKNMIFSKADIVSITCTGTTATDPLYPCTIQLRALFAANNPYLFINNKDAKP